MLSSVVVIPVKIVKGSLVGTSIANPGNKENFANCIDAFGYH